MEAAKHGSESTPLLVKSVQAVKSREALRAKSQGLMAEKGEVTAPQGMKHYLIISSSISLVVIGVLYFMWYERFAVVTAIYVIVQIVTTIGYGDFTLNGNWPKFVMSIYALLILVLVAYSLNELSQKVFDKQSKAIKHRLKQRQQHDNPDDANHGSKNRAMNETIAAFVLFACFVAFGTIFYGTYEACTCSYGVSFVKGCDETSFEICTKTGGFTKSYFEAFYMSVITLTTIGFGDHTPRSYVGRAVGCVWMVLGVVATGNFVNKISKMFHEADLKLTQGLQEGMSEETFKKIDTNNSGTLDRAEFLKYTLLQYGVVEEHMIEEIDALFDKLDVQKENQVSFEQIQRSHEATHPANTAGQP